MLNVRKIKPIGSQVQVTEEVYAYDDYNAAGFIETGHKQGDLKSYQTVIAIGDDVKFVKPGDVVEINLYKYAKFKEDPNSVKAMADNPIVEFRLNEVDMVDENGEFYPSFLIDQRDIRYVVLDKDEVTYDKNDALIMVPDKKKLIIPDKPLLV